MMVISKLCFSMRGNKTEAWLKGRGQLINKDWYKFRNREAFKFLIGSGGNRTLQLLKKSGAMLV